MARTKSATSMSSIFRDIFEENHDLLRVSSFEGVAEAYEAKFPGKKFTERERALAANIKGLLRKKHGIPGGRRKARRAKLASAGGVAVVQVRGGRTAPSLLKLEDMVDECMIAAKRVDPAGLEGVIKHLRAARNKIIHMQGDV